MHEYVFDQLAGAFAVCRRNADRVPQTQLMELGSNNRFVHAFDLVDGKRNRNATALRVATQSLGDNFVVRHYALPSIDHENDRIGFSDRLQRLLGHFMQDALGHHWLEAAGIDAEVGARGTLAMAIVAIAGKARHVGHNRITRFREAIEEHGFADIGPADDDDGRFHFFLTAPHPDHGYAAQIDARGWA